MVAADTHTLKQLSRILPYSLSTPEGFSERTAKDVKKS